MVLCRRLNKWQYSCADDFDSLKEGKSQVPNYSFDSWLKKAEDLGGEVSFVIDRAKERDEELDKEIEQKKQDKQKSKKQDSSDIKKDKESSWKKFKNVTKERKQKEKEDSSEDQSDRLD